MVKQTTSYPESNQFNNTKILIVDEDPEMLLLLKSVLASQNFLVENTTDANNAPDLAIKFQPALILLRLELSGQNGYDVCKQIKQNKPTSLIPVILISAFNDEISINKGFQSGAADVIILPIQSNDLIARVKSQLAIRNLRIEYENQNKQLQLQIKEKEQAEQLLKESEERYRLISNVITDYMFSTKIMPDGSLNLDWVAGAFESISGYTVEEYKALGGWRSTVHPDDFSIDDSDLKKLRQNRSISSEIRTINKKGEVVWVQVFAFPVWDEQANCLKGIYGAVQNISSRKNAEIKLRSSESQYRELLEKVGLISVILDIDGKVLFANNFLLELTGYSHDELMHADWFDLMIPESKPDVKKLFLSSLHKGNIDARFENPIKTKSGKTLDIAWSNVLRFNSEGRVISVASIGEDITERKISEETIRTKDRLLRMTGEMAKVGGWEFDTKTRKGSWSDEVARIHGLDPAMETNVEIGMSFYSGEYKAMIEHAIERAIREKESYELILKLTDTHGIEKWIKTIGIPIIENNEVVNLQGTFQDITQQKLVEEELQLLNVELEQRVLERTKELDNRNADLARMNRLFVGRELKMIELKNRIKDLEADIVALSRL